MIMRFTAQLMATEAYVSHKTGTAYTKMLFLEPGTTNTINLLLEGDELLGAAPGDIYECAVDYSERYQRLSLKEARRVKPPFSNPGPNPEKKAEAQAKQ